MSEFEEKLNKILGDPSAMEQIAHMAKSLMGSGQTTAAPPPPKSDFGEALNPAMPGKLSSAMGRKDDKQVLLMAMKPYLSPKRQEKLDRAMQLARMIHMAELAFGMFGGDNNAKI